MSIVPHLGRITSAVESPGRSRFGFISPAVFVLSIGVAAVDLTLAFHVPALIVPLQMAWARYYRGLSGNAG